MTEFHSDHPVQNSPVQSENIESASDRAKQATAEQQTSPADTPTDHPTGEAQAAENAETESPG